MNRPSTPALFVPLVAALAVAFPVILHFQPTAPQQQGATAPKRHIVRPQSAYNPAQKEKTQSAEKHDADRILTDFFDVRDYGDASWPEQNFRNRYCVDFMIATVPDPLDSRLPYLFDRFLASVQRAAEADHLVLDRYDLPWLEALQAKEVAKGSSGNDDQPASETIPVHPYDKEPGLIVFRDLDSVRGPRVLVLFVVGETPTAGINKQAFRSALDQIAGLWRVEHCGPNTKELTIPILGPAFSGSAESLDFTLESWLSTSKFSPKIPKPARFQIVSGSATAIPIDIELDDNGRHYFDLPKDLGNATFEATVMRDDLVTLPGFLEYLRTRQPRRWSPPLVRVAFLTEANTAYGNSLRNSMRLPEIHAASDMTAQSARAQTPSAQKQQPGRTDEELMALPFPLHISRLRSESEKLRQERAQSSQPASPSPDSSRYLPVPYEDESENARDAIPPFSGLDTSSAELVLANLLSTISHEQFDYVGIAATDVRDTIFLAREIREHSPSSVIFSFNADLIYAHPEANPNTRGMLIVTPYPLFTLNQRWMDPDQSLRDRLQFPDQNSEGVYNAMLVLLKRLPEKVEKPCEEREPLLEYGAPFEPLPSRSEPRVPPLWISTVGRQGFWPVALLHYNDKEHGYTHEEKVEPCPLAKPSSDVGRGLIPHASVFVYFCWSLLCCVPSFIFLRRATLARVHASSFFLRDFGFPALKCFQDPAFARNRGECHAYFLVGGVATLAAYVIAVTAYGIAIWRIPGLSHPGRSAVSLAAMLVVIAFTLSACLVLFKSTLALMGRSRGGPANGWLAFPVLAISMVSFVFAGWLSWEWIHLRDPQVTSRLLAASGIITGFRAINLTNGVSPLPPLFLIALAACVWAYSSVRRVRLAEGLPWDFESECDSQKDTPVAANKYALFNSASPSFQGFQELEARVQALLHCSSLHLPRDLRAYSLLTALTIVLAGFYLFYSRLVVALEPPVYYLLFGFCFVLVYLCIAFNILRLLFLWLGLRRVLTALERHPIRAAFARFHRSFPNLPRINLASAPSPVTALNFSIQQASALSRSAKTLVQCHPDLVNGVASAETYLEQAEASYREALGAEAGEDRCRSLVCQLQAQRSLAQASGFVEGALELSRKTSPVSGETDPALEAGRQKLSDQAEEFLVGRTVLFLSHIFPQMTNLAELSLASLLLMLMAVSSYPFQPHQLIVLFSWTLIFAFVGVALHMSVQMNRDTLLSNLNGTKPGELNWDRDFLTRILLYVVIPILGFLGVQFPDTVGQIFSFLSPGAAGHG